MERTDISIIEQKEDCFVENMTFTYSEEERIENTINRENAKLLFKPKFIPFYCSLLERGLSHNTILLFGFIDFYLGNSISGKFYFTNKQLGDILGISERTISESIGKLENDGIIITSRRSMAGGGQIRYISKGNTELEAINYDSQKSTSPTSKKGTTNNNILIIYNSSEFLENFNEEEKDKYRNEIYIINKMFDLGMEIEYDSIKYSTKQIADNYIARVSGLMKTFIPRKENGNIDRGIAKSYTDAWYDYWENPPKGKKKPTNFKTSLRNNIEMRSKPRK